MARNTPRPMPANMGEFVDMLSNTQNPFGKEVIRKWVGRYCERSLRDFRRKPFTKITLMTFRCFTEKRLAFRRDKVRSDERYVELCRQADEFFREIAEIPVIVSPSKVVSELKANV